jgi:cell division protein FtsQ
MSGVRLMRIATLACVLLALVGAAGGALAWVAQRPWFDFRAIEVRGDLRHVSAAAVRSAVAGQLAGNFFTMRLAQTRRAFEAVPWVADVSVRRRWPRLLEVTLAEHRAVGLWDDGRLLSDAGVLFAANAGEAEIDGPLVEFSGPEDAAGEAAERLREWAAILTPLSLEVARIEVSERASWALQTRSGSRLELGRDEPPGRLNERLTALAADFPMVLARFGAAPARIDLRYPNGFAVAPAATRP